jgi:hypothetical protein
MSTKPKAKPSPAVIALSRLLARAYRDDGWGDHSPTLETALAAVRRAERKAKK